MLFYIASLIAVFCTLMAISRANAVHALLYLVVSLLGAAAVMAALGAPLAAALEVVVYAGAIMVLFVFVIMLLNLGDKAVEAEKGLLSPSMWVGPSILSAILIAEFVYVMGHISRGSLQFVVDPKQVGAALYAPYLVGVELASMLLLAGIIGAYHLGWRKQNKR